MTIDDQIKAALERINRSIGQRVRHAKAEIAAKANYARASLEFSWSDTWYSVPSIYVMPDELNKRTASMVSMSYDHLPRLDAGKRCRDALAQYQNKKDENA
jgi:hypothetical protein